eukprot:5372701-Pyramimonas_sp.AAC.1
MYSDAAHALVQERLDKLAKRTTQTTEEETNAAGAHRLQQPGEDPLQRAPPHLRELGKAFRLFLSHRQLSGRYAVHRTHEALRDTFSIFLDVETGDLELHDL